MHNRTKILKLLTVAVLFAMLMSACVATPPPAAAPAEEQPTAAAGAEEAAAPAADAAPAAEGEKIVLRWANILDANGQEQWQPIIDAFQAKYPNIEISSESTAGSGAAVYPDVLKTSMASGSPPDVFFLWGGSIAEPFIKAGQVMDLAPYYEKYGWNGKFAPWVIERITVRWQALWRAVPCAGHGLLV